MPSGVDIGALSGRIDLEDNLSPGVALILHRLDDLEKKFGGVGKQAAASAVGFFSAEVALKAVDKAAHFVIDSFKELTLGGAAAADIEENFNRLTEQAGQLGETLLTTLRAGTHATIDDLTLMKMVNQDLAAGMQLTEGQMKTLTEGAFALAQATGTDVASGLETMNDALLTGRTRSLQMLTGKIDLEAAEMKYAAALGTTADRLSAEGKLEADRVAILESVSKATERLGEQTDGLDERVAQAQTFWKNYRTELGIAIATSPSVIHAWDAIQEALQRAFGTDSQTLLEMTIGWVNRIADAVALYGPIVIQWFKDALQFVTDLYHGVVDSWDALPDWLKTVAKDSALAGLGIYAVGSAAGAAGSSIMDMINVVGSMTTTLVGLPAILKGVATGFSATITAASGLSMLTGVGIAVASLTAVLTAGYQAWQLWSESSERAAADARQVSVDQANLERLNQSLGTSFTSLSEAVKEYNRRRVEGNQEATQAEHETLEATQARIETEKQASLVQKQSAEEAKKFREAMDELSQVGKGWKGTLDTINGAVVESIKYYLDAGVAQNQLAAVYGITATQVKAVAEALKEEQEAIKLSIEAQQKAAEIMVQIQKDRDGLLKTNIENAQDAADAEYDIALKAAQQKGIVDKEYYDALWAKRNDDIRKSKANWDDIRTHSKSALQDIADEARATYDFVSRNSQQFTQEYIELKRQEMEAAVKAVNEWGSTFQETTNDALQKERELKKAIDATAAAERNKGGSMEVTSQNFEQAIASAGLNPNAARNLAQQGYSMAEIMSILRSTGTGPVPPPQGPRIPGFSEGGIGDFGQGTLAMLHGQEAIVPLNRGMGLGNVTNHFYVNGTAEDVARKIKEVIMRELKSVRQFGAA